MKIPTENNYFQLVYEVVKRIPSGKVVTYGEIAQFLGNPRNARTVGYAMHSCDDSLPWYRVIMKSGKLPFEETDSSSSKQKKYLEKEGVTFLANGRVNLEKHRWKIELPS